MAQITIYLDDTLAQSMRAVTKTKEVSQSKWIATLIQEALLDEWPDDVKALAGAWQDFPSLEEIRQTDGVDVAREAF